MSMSIKKKDISGLIAGVAGGTDLDVILSLNPKKVYAIDFLVQ